MSDGNANGVAFIGLNAPAPNNHYLSAGGRNGEFEDRSVANAFWLEHAVETARRTEMRAVVVILQGDPDFARYERRDRFAWLRFSRGDTTRDGFLELKRSLVKAAELFRGPMIVIHGSDTPLPRGFRIDQPLRNDKGVVVANLTRIAIGLKKPQSQWLEVESDFGWRPPFRVRVRDVVVQLNAPVQASAPVSVFSAERGRRRTGTVLVFPADAACSTRAATPGAAIERRNARVKCSAPAAAVAEPECCSESAADPAGAIEYRKRIGRQRRPMNVSIVTLK